MADDDKEKEAFKVCCCFCVFILVALAGVLFFSFSFPDAVGVVVDKATLGRIVFSAPPAGNGTSNGNGTAAASLSYDLDLVVTVYNPNWAMRAWRTAPLYAELRFRGWAFHRTRMAGPAEWHQISPGGQVICPFTAANDGVMVPVALERHGVEELSRESAAGVLALELVVTGQFKYQTHSRRHNLTLSCPLKLALFTAVSPPGFRRVMCM